MLKTRTRLGAFPVFAFMLGLSVWGFSCARPERGASSGLKDIGEETGAAQNGSDGDVESVAILATNDIHGNLLPVTLRTREAPGQTPVTYEAGGATVLASYVKALKAKYGSHLIWLDAGDEFQGTIESNSEKGAPLVDFFNSLGLDAAAIGNHEFDYGPEGDPSNLLGALEDRMKQAKYPYLAANIVERANGDFPAFPNTKPSVLLNAGRLKIGVIGLSTLDTPKTTLAENVKTLEFSPLREATLRESHALRSAGADIVVIVAHVGLKCELGRAHAGNTIRKPTDLQGECGPHDEMVELLNSLPPGTVDAVVSGHSHQIVHHWIAGVPVVQGGAYARYFNLIYLSYDMKNKKLLTDRERIEGPIPICAKVFANQHDCNGDRPAPAPSPGSSSSSSVGAGSASGGPPSDTENNGRGKLVAMKFHGEPITEDADTVRLLQPAIERSAALKAEVLAQNARPVEHNRFGESELGDLVADAIRLSAQTDVALVNSGGIRISLEAGPVTYGEVFQALPFENSVSKLTLTGKELKLLLRVAESGSRGFPPVSGLRLKLIDRSADAPSQDLDGDGKTDLWEENRILGITLADGREIDDRKTYTLATLDFLVQGGDDLGWVMKQISAEKIQLSTGVLVRDAVVRHFRELAKLGEINSVEHPILDPENPRLRFVKPVKAAKNKKKRRHKAKQHQA